MIEGRSTWTWGSDSGKVVVNRFKGHTTRAFPLVFGAHGCRSVARAMLVHEGEPHNAARTTWHALISFDSRLLAPKTCSMSARAGKAGLKTHKFKQGPSFRSAMRFCSHDYVIGILRRGLRNAPKLPIYIEAAPQCAVLKRHVFDHHPSSTQTVNAAHYSSL